MTSTGRISPWATAPTRFDGDHLDQKIDNGQRFGAGHVARDRLLVEMRRIDVQARARLEQIADGEPDQQGQR